MGERIGEDVAEAVEVVLQGGAVPPLLLRFGFEATDGGLQRLDVFPQRRVLLLVLRRRFPQLPQLRFAHYNTGSTITGRSQTLRNISFSAFHFSLSLSLSLSLSIAAMFVLQVFFLFYV